MEKTQLWQCEGLDADKDTLKKVIYDFKTEGTQGMESQKALERYISTLSDSSLQDMCEIDEETTVQILADCFGARKAFSMLKTVKGYITWEKVHRLGWISPAAYTEVVKKYEKRTKKLEDEKDEIWSKYENAIQREEIAEKQREEIAEKQREELQNTLAHYKADLYDFYAQAGKLPNYERG